MPRKERRSQSALFIRALAIALRNIASYCSLEWDVGQDAFDTPDTPPRGPLPRGVAAVPFATGDLTVVVFSLSRWFIIPRADSNRDRGQMMYGELEKVSSVPARHVGHFKTGSKKRTRGVAIISQRRSISDRYVNGTRETGLTGLAGLAGLTKQLRRQEHFRFRFCSDELGRCPRAEFRPEKPGNAWLARADRASRKHIQSVSQSVHAN